MKRLFDHIMIIMFNHETIHSTNSSYYSSIELQILQRYVNSSPSDKLLMIVMLIDLIDFVIATPL